MAYEVAWGPVPLRLAVIFALLAAGTAAVGGYMRSQWGRREFGLRIGGGRPEDLAELVGVTPGECEVLTLLAKGFSVSQAASMLFLSPAAVTSRRSRAYKKLGIHRRGEIAPTFERILEARMAQI